MFQNFTDEYKQLMLDTEARVKQHGYKEILPEDVFIQMTYIVQGGIFEIFSSFGVNKEIVIDVLSRPPFNAYQSGRVGEYAGISQRLKDLIVMSMKIAAGFQKSKAGVEDFLLAMFRIQTENWFYQLLDFIGISPKDFEGQILEASKLAQSKTGATGDIFGPIDNIMEMLEQGFSGSENPANPQQPGNPFSINKPQEGKKESPTPAIDFFGTDLTAEARIGKIDPIIGRDTEIDRLISVLNRKTKNNPCLVGDPGVGKTAIVEGLALRIAQGKIPFAMQGKRVIALDMSSMVAGTKYRGEFEARIKQVIDEASKMENEIILFIDEIHTIIGAGGGEGGLDAANILKPAMSRGKICLIGATTLSEYQKHIEKDSALERRFQKIDAAEPDIATTTEVIKGIRESFEDFHNLIIDDDAIEDAIALSVRYLTDRFLPDKAIDLIDEACSTKSMTYNFDSKEITDLKAKMQEIQKDIENFVISQQYQKAMTAKKRLEEIGKEIDEKKRKRVIPREERLHITTHDVQRVIHQMTGVPLKNLESEDISRLRILSNSLKKRILGQDDAVDAIVSSLKRNRVGISNQNRPIGSFLFLGPTGVGKTELVKVLAEEFFGDSKALVKIDMSEYQDKSSASKLIGTTAGYVGYEEGGLLTEKVRRKPYSIVLFDEIEKGNFDIYNLLLQILEDGTVTDGKGRKVNFKNTIIIMTSNIGSDEFNSKARQIGFSVSESEEAKIIHDYAAIREKILGQLNEYFAPEFINRIDKIVTFNPLDKGVMKKIITLQLDELIYRMKSVKITLTYDMKTVNFLLKETYNPEFGARPVRRFIQDSIEDSIADAMIEKKLKDSIQITVGKKGLEFQYN